MIPPPCLPLNIVASFLLLIITFWVQLMLPICAWVCGRGMGNILLAISPRTSDSLLQQPWTAKEKASGFPHSLMIGFNWLDLMQVLFQVTTGAMNWCVQQQYHVQNSVFPSLPSHLSDLHLPILLQCCLSLGHGKGLITGTLTGCTLTTAQCKMRFVRLKLKAT